MNSIKNLFYKFKMPRILPTKLYFPIRFRHIKVFLVNLKSNNRFI